MRHFMAISNGINAIIALILSLITAFARRCILSGDGKAAQKFERRLLIQAFISSIIFGSYCALTAAYSILYPLSNVNITYALAFDITLDLGNLFYMTFHYSSAVLLMIVSGPVRRRFIMFYQLNRILPVENSTNSTTRVTKIGRAQSLIPTVF
uniref:7TM GPCR serpentine receptor class x (Srx) domain-containing protein n=1 Tax=Panagrolaimus davidi TaxID=227884 RepID=A0A914PEA9_9BILA